MLKKITLIIVFIFLFLKSNAQIDSTFVDTKYLEDQIYFGFAFNLMLSKPESFNQNGVSGGISVGYIRDIPLNKDRNVGLGIGAGYAYNAYYQNLKISENDIYEIVPNEDFNTNWFTTSIVEIPIEFRWRTSTPTKYSFWRIYAGVKFGYVFTSRSKYADDIETVKVKNINELEKLQYGLMLSAGYSTFNLNVYYGLNTFFKNAEVNGQPINLRQLNVGLMFYIL